MHKAKKKKIERYICEGIMYMTDCDSVSTMLIKNEALSDLHHELMASLNFYKDFLKNTVTVSISHLQLLTSR